MLYSKSELEKLNHGRVPRHVAIVPDGNRRWARRHLLDVLLGHRRGSEALVRIVEAAAEVGVAVLTVYAFSTENWQRSAKEVASLMENLADYLRKERETMKKDGVRLAHIGDLTPVPDFVKEELFLTEKETAGGERLTLVLAINYGARDEICRALQSVLDAYRGGELQERALDEKLLASYLDTAPFGDPELFIRTSGEHRMSNFLLWQNSYSELYFTETLWPDFTPAHFLEALVSYQKREQRLGG